MVSNAPSPFGRNPRAATARRESGGEAVIGQCESCAATAVVDDDAAAAILDRVIVAMAALGKRDVLHGARATTHAFFRKPPLKSRGVYAHTSIKPRLVCFKRFTTNEKRVFPLVTPQVERKRVVCE